MNLFDAIILLACLLLALRGFKIGLVQQILSGVGFILGLLIGMWLSPKLPIQSFDAGQRVMLSVLVILSIASLFLIIFEFLSLWVKQWFQKPIFLKIDGALGSVASVFLLLAIIWLSTPLLSRAPSIEVRDQARSSIIASELQTFFPSAPSLVARLGQILDSSRFPQVFTGREPSIDVTTPLPNLGSLNTAVQASRVSTVKIEGVGCGGIVEGSGFVGSANYVITNAHVIAGIRRPTIVDAAGRHQATPVWFDADLDLAILRTTDLAGKPLPIEPVPAAKGAASVVLGYPGGGDFTAKPAVVLDVFTARGRNIYNDKVVDREVYSVRSDIRSGNSGGPLVRDDGKVIGVVFAESTQYNQIGYAITMQPVIDALAKSQTGSQVSTGECAE